jgi:hypothetical protein
VSGDQLCPCGLGTENTGARCLTCPAARTARSTAGSPASVFAPVGQATRTTDPQANVALMRYSRWKKTDGTFGPAGRIIATLLLLVPLPILLLAVASGIGIIGVGLYLIVVMPWALRDIWKKAAIAIEPPKPADVHARF